MASDLAQVTLPSADPTPPNSRRCYAAAHVFASPLTASQGGHRCQIDWDATLAERGREEALRAALPGNVLMLTGDDHNYVDLIAGDGTTYSHALLGAFSLIAPITAAAIRRLDVGDEAGYRALLEPTTRLCRLVFEPPTRYYKVGVVWLAYLAGRQDHFRMIEGLESARSIMHLVWVLELADELGLFPDPDLAAARVSQFLTVHGMS